MRWLRTRRRGFPRSWKNAWPAGPATRVAKVTIAIPTLAADDALAACLDSLRAQTFRDFEVIVIDNSGQNRVQDSGVTVIANERNAGFGAAINQAFRQSAAPYFATLNDDTTADENWLGALVSAMEQRPEIGMCAPRIVLAGDGRMD